MCWNFESEYDVLMMTVVIYEIALRKHEEQKTPIFIIFVGDGDVGQKQTEAKDSIFDKVLGVVQPTQQV